MDRNNDNPFRAARVTVIDDLFSRKWNRLFDDGLFYSCYALTFRDKKVKTMYKNLTDSLRERLSALIERCNAAGVTDVSNPLLAAALIFALIDGSYFYLSLSDNPKTFAEKIIDYKLEAYRLLRFSDAVVAPCSGI